MVLTKQSALTQKLRQNTNYPQLGGMINRLYAVMTILLNRSIFAVQNLRGLRRLSPPWLRAWQQWLMAICRGVTREAQFPRRRVNMGAPNHYGGRRKVQSPKIQKCHKCFLQCSIFSSPRPQFRTWGRQTCFLLRAPSNLVTSLAIWFCLILLLQVQTRSQLTPATKRQICHG